jgi:hypothetical protein
MRNATIKAEELANISSIKRNEGTKIGKVIKHLQSSKLRWAHICAQVVFLLRNTSRQISFEFLFIKTRPPHILDIGFRRGIE